MSIKRELFIKRETYYGKVTCLYYKVLTPPSYKLEHYIDL